MWTYKARADRPEPPSRLPADAWPQGKAGPQHAEVLPRQTIPAPTQQAARPAPPAPQPKTPHPSAQKEDNPHRDPLKPPQNSAFLLTRNFALQKKYAQRFAIFYLLGLAGGSLCSAALSGAANEYFSRFLNAVLQRRAAEPIQLFSRGFLTAFFQLTLVMLCGFFVFGGLLLALLCALKGAVFGGLCAALLARFGPQAALGIALLWLPEVLQTLLLLLLSGSACAVSLWLARLCFDVQPGRAGPLRQLLSRYTAVCLAAALPCALSVLLQMLFPSLPGLG